VRPLLALLLLAAPASAAQVGTLKITVLSTSLAGPREVGEWGFAALVEADGRRLLFDSGARPDTVQTNARALGVDLSGITEVVISHNHGDHTGGLLALRRALAKRNPAALAQVHVGRGAFYRRPSKGGGESNRLLRDRQALLDSGVHFTEHAGPVELWPGVWLTGPVPRTHPERNWTGTGQVMTPGGLVEDTLPEDQSLVFDTAEGLVLLSGCGHAGVINTIEYARKLVRSAPLAAAIGGFHLFDADPRRLAWTVDHLRALELQRLLGAHCTGHAAIERVRKGLSLARERCVEGSVGAWFSWKDGQAVVAPRAQAR